MPFHSLLQHGFSPAIIDQALAMLVFRSKALSGTMTWAAEQFPFALPMIGVITLSASDVAFASA